MLRAGNSPEGATIGAGVPRITENSVTNTAITFRSPKKYNPVLPSSTAFQSPPLEWLQGTWSVTHSTLPMWRKAKNVRITYKIIPPISPSRPTLLDDEVCSEPTQKTFMPQPKSIKGIDTPDGDGAWNWRGKGLLKVASSHWEVLGWGEKDGERWVVTWFAPSLFTPAGMDIYSGRKEGMSEGLYQEIMKGLEGLEAKEMAELCKKEMFKIEID
ncbi:hypothetical protein D0Z07_8902 [Hyphodiscus hymeniophilus]|uniref:Uncharacterized protein n=1 Tax=Hyphodiscus hymeniophilus TaxID=353542 RepID=A0A9P6VDN1_9HELO|nr:hypothetical protein D0Z07_8902 [Hyphodiscus hymeniophilus]